MFGVCVCVCVEERARIIERTKEEYSNLLPSPRSP